MTSQVASLGLVPIESFDPSTIVSRAVYYRFHATGTQSCALGNGPDLVNEGNAISIVAHSTADFGTTSMFRNATNSWYIDRLLNMQNWTTSGGLVVCCDVNLATTPSAISNILQYGRTGNVGGWGLAITTTREVRIEAWAVGASSIVDDTTFLDPAITAGARMALAFDLYLDSATTLAGNVYVNGDSYGGFSALDLLNGGTAIPGTHNQRMKIGVRESNAETFVQYFGATADMCLGNVFITYTDTRDATLAQDLSRFFYAHPGEMPRIMQGR